MEYAASVYTIDHQWRVPTLPTIERHAKGIGCQPWQLLQDVTTEYDLAREIAGMPAADAASAWLLLMGRIADRKRRRAPAPLVRRTPTQPMNSSDVDHAISGMKRVVAAEESRERKTSSKRTAARKRKR